jgi:putative ABC transport system permease protein
VAWWYLFGFDSVTSRFFGNQRIHHAAQFVTENVPNHFPERHLKYPARSGSLIFMVLGGLGVLLGSAGLGIVAARNILERRAELALLRALGFRHGQLLLMLFLEHGALALAGLSIGVLAAGVAVAPALLAPESIIPWTGLSLTIASVLAGSLIWIGLAMLAAMRGDLLSALRME